MTADLHDYCTLTQLKARLWPPTVTPDTTDDTSLQAIITSVSYMIEGSQGCSRPFIQSGTTNTPIARYFQPKPTFPYEVYIDDLISASKVETDDDGSGAFVTLWATTDYDLYPYNAAVDGKPYTKIVTAAKGQNVFLGGYKSLKITGIWGWSAIPAMVTEACIRQCIINYRAQFGVVPPEPASRRKTPVEGTALADEVINLLSEYIKYV